MMTLDDIDDATAAQVFRRLRHLRHRSNAEKIGLMRLAGFRRNCLCDWIAEASGGAITNPKGSEAIYGLAYADWKAKHQTEATPEQPTRMAESLKRNPQA